MTYTAAIQDTAYLLEDNSDVDDFRFEWAADIPTCPECHELLTAFCDTTKQASIHTVWMDEYKVECDNCGWRSGLLKEAK